MLFNRFSSNIFQCISLCCLVISACHRTKMILLPRARAHTHPNTIWEIINESQTKYERKKIIFIFQQRYWAKAHSRRKYYKLRFSECCWIQLIFTVAQKNVIKTDFSHFYYYCYAFFFHPFIFAVCMYVEYWVHTTSTSFWYFQLVVVYSVLVYHIGFVHALLQMCTIPTELCI